MALQNSWAARVAVVSLIASAFAALASTAFTLHVASQNDSRLAELNRQLLNRSEMAIDYAVVSLVKLAERGALDCGAASQGDIRRLVYQLSIVKDIHVLDSAGAIQCSALPDAEGLGFVPAKVELGEQARNRGIALLALGADENRQIGVSWRMASGDGLLASVNINALFFDILPPALRDDGQAELVLGGAEGSIVARYAPADTSWSASEDALALSVQSKRYPLEARLLVDSLPLKTWNMEAQPIFTAFGGGLGFAFALLLLRALKRPHNPLEDIDAALAAGEFHPYLQPIFSIEDKRIIGCEALTRWIRKDGTVATPDRFIGLMEESGRIIPMTRLVMEKTLFALRALLARDPAFKVAFNVVPDDFLSPGFPSEMAALVARAGVDPRSVVMELTERQQISDLAVAARAVAAIRQLGFKVALDDTGTGHNGLSYVQSLGADTIKIDKIFVDAIGRDMTGSVIIEMLVRLAATLSMKTVAEGVETDEQLAALQACGVDEGQGYLVSRPVPMEQFLALVADQGRQPEVSKALAA